MIQATAPAIAKLGIGLALIQLSALVFETDGTGAVVVAVTSGNGFFIVSLVFGGQLQGSTRQLNANVCPFISVHCKTFCCSGLENTGNGIRLTPNGTTIDKGAVSPPPLP